MLDGNECITSYLHSNIAVTTTYVTNDQLGMRYMMFCNHGVPTRHVGDSFFGIPECNLKDLLQPFSFGQELYTARDLKPCNLHDIIAPEYISVCFFFVLIYYNSPYLHKLFDTC